MLALAPGSPAWEAAVLPLNYACDGAEMSGGGAVRQWIRRSNLSAVELHHTGIDIVGSVDYLQLAHCYKVLDDLTRREDRFSITAGMFYPALFIVLSFLSHAVRFSDDAVRIL